MSNFFGTNNNDVANSALGELTGFTGSILEELVDGISDTFLCGAGDDFVFAGSAGDLIQGGEGFDKLNGAEGDDIIYGHLQASSNGSLIGDEILGNVGNDKIFGSAGADRLEGGPDDDDLFGNSGNDVLLGEDGDDSLNGSDGDDLLQGGNGADFLSGDKGRDELFAGGDFGDRLFFSAGDVVAGEIIDGGTIVTGANDFTVATINDCPQIEMTFGGIAKFTAAQILANLTAGGNIATSNGGNVRIEMGTASVAQFKHFTSGNVFVIGDGSNEIISALGTHTLLGNGGDDRLTGGGVLSGGTGDDFLEGSAGNDTIIGGEGVDTMSWAAADSLLGIVFTLAEGGDGDTGGFSWVGFDVFSGIESIVSGDASDNLTGNSVANMLAGSGGNDQLQGAGGNDKLDGGAGNDSLNGGTGSDTLIGGTGNDLFHVDSAGDKTIEIAGGGNDSVRATLNWTLGAELENLYLLGVAVSGTGNGLANSLFGNAAANMLDGKAGNDRMQGGDGNDVYRAGSSGDLAIETNAAAAGGIDRVHATASFTLGANIERLVLEGAAAINGIGNAIGNVISGNGANNFIDGKSGIDTLGGGLGKDSFAFTTIPGPTNIDVVTDFAPIDDTLRLENAVFAGLPVGYLSAAAFHIGTTAADAADRIVYNSATGAVYFDADGLGGAAQVQFARLSAGLALTDADVYVF